MTISSLVNGYQKNVTATRLKHAYSVLSQAIVMAEVENDSVANWDFSKIEEYLEPHFKYTTREELTQNGALGITYSQLSGEPETGLIMMGNQGGSSIIYSLANGTQIFLTNHGSFIIDINGYKKPNRFGKDVFMFGFTKEHKLYPMGLYSTKECQFEKEPNNDREVLKNGTCYNYGCNKKARGMWCGALIMTDGWKISPDYPW